MQNPYLKAELLKPGGVASRLAEARRVANLGGKDLAHRTGFAPSKISKLELGHQVPSANDVHVWLKACGGDARNIRETQQALEESLAAHSRVRQWAATPAAGLNDSLPMTLADAYQLGYEAALADMRRQLTKLSDDAAKSGGDR
jgi:transcriptional regulator with XRE-family HTH domain